MKINELYINTSPLLPVPEQDLSRLVIVRGFDCNMVSFSVCSYEQPNLEYSIVRFRTSAFTVKRSFFEEFFESIGDAVSAGIGGLS